MDSSLPEPGSLWSSGSLCARKAVVVLSVDEVNGGLLLTGHAGTGGAGPKATRRWEFGSEYRRHPDSFRSAAEP